MMAEAQEKADKVLSEREKLNELKKSLADAKS